MKRIMPRARGRANRIRKRTSHISSCVKRSIKEVSLKWDKKLVHTDLELE